MATKTIGTTARNYATIALWESYLDGGGNSGSAGVLGEAEIGEAYNDSEFDEAVTFSGYTTSAANTVTLRPAAGQGFRDNPSAALAYNQANGVAWKKGGVAFTETCVVLVDFLTVFGMQISGTSAYINYVTKLGTNSISDLTSHSKVDSCILTHTAKTTVAGLISGKYINCLLYADGTSTAALLQQPSFNAGNVYGCTFARTSNNAAGGTGLSDNSYGFAGTIKNCAIFGFTTVWGPDATWASQTYCATDQASFPAAVTGGVTSLTFTSQFADSDNVGTDFKALASGGLKAGTPDSTNTPVDIFGTTRDATTPYIGCYEVASVASSGPSAIVGPTRTASRGVGAQVQRYLFRQPVVFSRGLAIYALALNSGAYTITGTASALLHAAMMNAVAGAYTISGQSASVLRGSLVGATAGSYVISGQSAALLAARKVSATAGGYNISGVSASALRQAFLALAAGGYNITGASATLVYTPNSSSSTSSLYIDLNNGHLIWRLL